MSSFDQETIDEINNSFNIADLIGKSPKVMNFRHTSGGQYVGHTNPDSKSKASLKVNSLTGEWHDLAAGIGGRAIHWIGYEAGYTDFTGRDFIEIIHLAADKAGIEIKGLTEEEKRSIQEWKDLKKIWSEAADIYHKKLEEKPELYDYIKEKWDLNKETVDKYRLGYASEYITLHKLDKSLLNKSGLVKVDERVKEIFNDRITFPYLNKGEVVYFAGRARREDVKPKYMKLMVSKEGQEYVSPLVQNSFFYGEDSVTGKKECVITEGVTDCLSMLQAGFPCISPVTKEFKETDAPKLIQICKRLNTVYICNDNEENNIGRDGALKTAELLEKEGIPVRIVVLPRPEGVNKVDIAEYMKTHTAEDFKRLQEESLGLWEFKLSLVKIPIKTLDKLRVFETFISNDLHLMRPGEWDVFVNNDVVKKFLLTKKDAKTTIEETAKARQNYNDNNNKEETEGNEPEIEEEERQRKFPPLEERLKEYPEEVIKKANEILDSKDPFTYICNIWNEIHVGDRNLGEMLACSIACTQVLNAGLGIHEKPSGDAESGKSHACLSMGKLCPPWKFRSTTFSPKVLYYMSDLMPGTILYTDDIDLSDKGVISTIKKVTADFKDPTLMDTVIDGKPAKMSIPERINFWLSSVDSIDDVQLGTRFIFSNTESGSEHDHEVNHKQKGRCLGAIPEECNENVLICRCVLEYICNDLYNVFSAYGFVSTWSEESKKRNQEKFLDVLLSVTAFNYRQRETVHGNLIGTLDDWKRAVSIYSHVAQNNSCMLTDEEIIILYSIYEMCKTAYDGEGVPHKRLFAYMKETGRFKESDSSLKRILLGDRTGGKQGFKEKVPGFTFDKVEMPKLDENGLEVKGAGKTRALCYSYDGDLFDGLPDGVDVVSAIKDSTFVNCDYDTAKALEQAFKADPSQVYRLKDNSGELEKWKHELRNQKVPSEIIRNPQNSNALNSEKSIHMIANNNNKTNNNKLRNHENGDIRGIDNSGCVYAPGEVQETHAKKSNGVSGNFVNSVNSEPSASDQALISEGGVLNSEATDNDKILNSEVSEIKKCPTNSDTIGLLKRALNKFAWDEYHGMVSDIDEFIRSFNKKVPEYKKALGDVVVGYNANKLHMRGWR